MSDHTPGPWVADSHGMYINAPGERGEWSVAQTRGWGYLTGKGTGALGLSAEEAIAIQKANANLIAAAPDLLEALKAAMAFIDSHVADWDLTDDMAVNYRHLLSLKPDDVIARAEGRP